MSRRDFVEAQNHSSRVVSLLRDFEDPRANQNFLHLVRSSGPFRFLRNTGPPGPVLVDPLVASWPGNLSGWFGTGATSFAVCQDGAA